MNLLLHCCCAPCSVACIKNLREENIKPRLFWYNPNIAPLSEYKSRRDCLTEYAESERLELTTIDDELPEFLTHRHGGAEGAEVKRERCGKCYRIRLEKAASFAKQEGFSAFTTTLLISPYQDHDVIKRIGEETAAKYGVDFFYRDFRPLFRESQSNSRAVGMYMQKYCGCIFSKEERYSKNFTQRHGGTEDTEKNLKSEDIFDRVSLLIGNDGLEKLQNTSVLVFGAGGVGSWAAEALVRSGIGKIGIIDNDTVCASNVNRQIEATILTLGLPKASTLKKRLLEINPQCKISAWDELFCLENAGKFDIEKSDYVIDAIDTLAHKLDLIEITCNAGITLFSSMGMALKMDPSQITAGSIWKTDVCPLARLVRQGLRKRGFSGDFTAVSSKEPLTDDAKRLTKREDCRRINGSLVTVTATAGLKLASLVLNDVINQQFSADDRQ
jgi:hypothetical protein